MISAALYQLGYREAAEILILVGFIILTIIVAARQARQGTFL
jgi:hypothetical protein